jgi:hypothetical protein
MDFDIDALINAAPKLNSALAAFMLVQTPPATGVA